jgi:diguanylate cyclase (GGDEF)-like protein
MILTLLGAAILSNGLGQFCNRSQRWQWQAFLVVGASLVGLLFMFVWRNNNWRMAVISLATAVLLTSPGLDLAVHSRRQSYRAAAMLTGLPLLIYSAFLLFRAGVALVSERPLSILDPAPIQVLFFLFVFLTSSLWTGGFLLMIATRLRHDLHAQARQDLLTGLPNRLAMVERLEVVRRQFEQQQQPFSVLLLDIDHFKNINDQFGHAEGDRTLKLVAETLRDSLRKAGQMDYVARWGGEEFLAVLPGAHASAAAVVGERLRATIAGLPVTPPRHAPITISVGIGVWSDTCQSPDDLLRAADRALYAAKQNGRNQVRL